MAIYIHFVHTLSEKMVLSRTKKGSAGAFEEPLKILGRTCKGSRDAEEPLKVLLGTF